MVHNLKQQLVHKYLLSFMESEVLFTNSEPQIQLHGKLAGNDRGALPPTRGLWGEPPEFFLEVFR